jgi:hypothetical protein
MSTHLPSGFTPSDPKAYEAAVVWAQQQVDAAEAEGRDPEDYAPDPRQLAMAFCALMHIPPDTSIGNLPPPSYQWWCVYNKWLKRG